MIYLNCITSLTLVFCSLTIFCNIWYIKLLLLLNKSKLHIIIDFFFFLFPQTRTDSPFEIQCGLTIFFWYLARMFELKHLFWWTPIFFYFGQPILSLNLTLFLCHFNVLYFYPRFSLFVDCGPTWNALESQLKYQPQICCLLFDLVQIRIDHFFILL